MPSYSAPVKDIKFILQNVLKIHDSDIPGYGDLDNDYLNAILEEASKISSEVLAPLNAIGDKHGCRFENGIVYTPPGFKEAFNQLKDGGWTGIDCDIKFGGQGLPYLISIAVGEMFASANMALGMYHGLTHGAYSAIYSHGSEEQKDKYLPNLVNCKWTGTMNLTEPHCGTDLGMMRTKASRNADGTFRISGQKIFISAGDHDLAENIIHLVLAKIPNGPDGVKGISLFIVPKFLVNEDGSLGERNQVSVGKIEQKMGIEPEAIRRLVAITKNTEITSLNLSRKEVKKFSLLKSLLEKNSDPAELVYQFDKEIAQSVLAISTFNQGENLKLSNVKKIEKACLYPCPISGAHLSKYMSGADVGIKLKEARRAWIKSNFKSNPAKILKVIGIKTKTHS